MPVEGGVRVFVESRVASASPARHGWLKSANSILGRAERLFEAFSKQPRTPDGDKRDLEGLRGRLASMDDRELLRFGYVALFEFGNSSLQGATGWQKYVALREGRAEWRRRHRGSVIEDSF